MKKNFLVCLTFTVSSLVSVTSVARTEKNVSGDLVTFQKGLDAGISGQPLRGIGMLKTLERKKTSAVGEDILEMNIGRLYFQLGRLDEAIESFDKVKKSSDFWLEAQEEKAHAFGRQREFNKVISTLMTVEAPMFDGQVGPEPYFVSALTSYKICDYTAIFKVSDLYKKRFKPRVHALVELADNGTSDHLQAAITHLEAGDLSIQSVGGDAKFLPRNFWHDETIKNNLLKAKQSAKSSAGSGEGASVQVQANRSLISSRVVALARQELKEIQDVTQKLNILEADVIQRIHAFEKSNKDRPVQGELASSSSDTLVFPQTDETWVDELDSYQAQIKGCPERAAKKNL